VDSLVDLNELMTSCDVKRIMFNETTRRQDTCSTRRRVTCAMPKDFPIPIPLHYTGAGTGNRYMWSQALISGHTFAKPCPVSNICNMIRDAPYWRYSSLKVTGPRTPRVSRNLALASIVQYAHQGLRICTFIYYQCGRARGEQATTTARETPLSRHTKNPAQARL
jgi:hypothetical protein